MSHPTRSHDPPTPAQQLVGRTLSDNWYVEELLERAPESTGGHFSTSYIVRNNRGQRAFLKAMDFRLALGAPDPSRTLQQLTAAYNFERDVLVKCRDTKLSRIVRILDDGKINAVEGDPGSVVQYLIFELASRDIRSAARFGNASDHAWILRTIHGAAAALRQLHGANIAHQDVKPSNVLLFPNRSTKLADLGRSADPGLAAPHDSFDYAGDPAYAPPELLYGSISSDWRVRRIATDLYLLGSLVVYLYTGVSLTHMLMTRVNPGYGPRSNLSYEEVLPYLQHEFAQILREFRQAVPADVSGAIGEVVAGLCDLRPEKRGHAKAKLLGRNSYSLERYVSLFDLLATKAEWSLRKVVVWPGRIK